MTRIIVIDPRDRTITTLEVDAKAGPLHASIITPGKGGVDHGQLMPGFHIIVNGFGLVGDGEDTGYFSLGRQLFNGAAVVYATDEAGETIDTDQEQLDLIKAVAHFYGSTGEVEAAIASYRLQRPQMSINGKVVWRWPDKRGTAT